MYITQLNLQHFRAFKSRVFNFSETVLITGNNAAGKTTIMEAINCLATAQSFRATKVEEMIQFDQELARATGTIKTDISAAVVDEESLELELLLTRGIVQGKKTQRRLYSVNGVRRRQRDFVGKILTVTFRPEDMRLIEGSPPRRRKFLDTPLFLTDPGYAQALNTYEQALKRKNKLLDSIRDGSMPVSVLEYWNQTLLKHGQYIQNARQRLVATFRSVSFALPFEIKYLPSVITAERQKTYQDREVAAARTLIGPQKDDFRVVLSNQNLPSDQVFDIALYGSRGQQRLAVLWLKLCEWQFLHATTNQTPVLLLDDILSELDTTSRGYVYDFVNQGQTIITSADIKASQQLQSQLSNLAMIELV